MAPQAFYLSSPRGPRFCIYHPPQGPRLRGLVLYAHPFAEEMNCARQMAALQSHALAATGFAVLQPDLLGCGDSPGDFGDASWEDWLADLLHATHWLRGQHRAQAGAPTALWLWGLRAGCLLCQQTALQLEPPCHLLYWQPPASGRQVLQQFLRLHQAGLALAKPDRARDQAQAAPDLLAQLLQGHSVEVAGYRLRASLARALLDCQRVALPGRAQPCRVHWMELRTQPSAPLSAMDAAEQAQWNQAGVQLKRQSLQGPAFWLTPGTAPVAALLHASTQALCADLP